MSTDSVAIRVEHLSKRYRIGRLQRQHDTLRDLLADSVKGIVRRGARNSAEESTIWALHDIAFEVQQGEAVAVVGRNGAGKSTLLKILARITEPTSGYADIYGRVGSLLEVGTGFHAELTGRENIYLSGAILGMRRHEIARKFDEIVAFAEIAPFLDTPVKRYSSGMYVRLAFAVAAHLEPEILVVDEVLAVGDAAFQKKCLGKMGAVAEEGRTVLFVSHNLAAVKALCTRAVLLEGGRQVLLGPVDEVINYYVRHGAESLSEQTWSDLATAPGNRKARLRAVRVLDAAGQPVTQVEIDNPFYIEIEYTVLESGAVLNTSLSLFSQEDAYVLASPSLTDRHWAQRPHPPGTYASRCAIPGQLLNQGRYSITALLIENGANLVAQVDRAVSVDIVDTGSGRGGYFGPWGGVVRPILEWSTECLPTR